MTRIQQLSTSVINKIAAGEVIERPASVVKELMENAVDAGATRIEVTIEKGGTDLVRVTDDGCGIAAEELELALASHATSKIRSADDLFHVDTMGFRGEALASISEVSHFRIQSRTREQDAGAFLEVEGGERGPLTPCGCPCGTTIEVRNLFFNTPVRRKYLKTVPSETGHVTEAFHRIALAHPWVQFSLKNQQRQVYDLPPAERWRDRIQALFGEQIAESLMWVESNQGEVRLTGYVADPAVNRGNSRMQYLFLNGRHIRDRSLQHALTESYRGLLLHGRYPISFLRLEMPAEMVDVNVHPTKLEVRFQDGGRLYSQLLGTIRRKFLSSDLTAKVPREPAPAAAGQSATPYQLQSSGTPSQARLDLQATPGSLGRLPEFRPFDMPAGEPHSAAEMTPVSAEPSSAPPAPVRSVPADATQPDSAGPTIVQRGIQLHNRYLITENESGMVVIDQHALHERILYEKFKAKILARELETQRLLMPRPVQLTVSEVGAVLEAKQALAQLGIAVEPFGGDTVLVSSYPAMLARIGPEEMLKQIVEILLAGPKLPDSRDLVDELLHMMACKAAVKAGDHLSPEEVTALLEQRHLFEDTHHCPHGRPTALVFSREELDRRFLRT